MVNVTLVTGDGIGPEIAEAARRCIDATGAGIDWSDALARLGGRGTNQILVEGGAAILHTLLDAGLVDRFYLLESGREIGVGGVSASPGGDIGAALGAAGLCVVHERPLGGDRVTVFERAR